MLNVPRIERWIKDLESGKFAQGRKRLRDSNDRYCCLGVLGNQYVEDGLATWEDTYSDTWSLHVPYDGEEISVLPNYVQEDMGLDQWGGVDHSPYYFFSLQYLDDGKNVVTDFRALTAANDVGVLFKEIAQGLRDLLATYKGEQNAE